MTQSDDFARGYRRDPETVNKLVEAVRSALYAIPGQRLGQIIVNATNRSDPFYVRDEELIERLNHYGGRAQASSEAACPIQDWVRAAPDSALLYMSAMESVGFSEGLGSEGLGSNEPANMPWIILGEMRRRNMPDPWWVEQMTPPK